uniref:SAS-6_N domain-containing protein n=1 Tax=Panagrellus redivivus TaxID=6233 RepID=A0A7E4UMJ6_PANRE
MSLDTAPFSQSHSKMSKIFDEDVDAKLIGQFPIENPRLRLKIVEEVGGDNGKTYNIELYDASHVAFVHRLKFSRAEYERLRREQKGILASFDQIPKILIENSKATRSDTNQWVECTFNADRGCEMRVVREGNIRKSCELSMTLPAVTHEELVQHLTARYEAVSRSYKQVKSQNLTLEREHKDCKKQLQSSSETIALLTDKLEESHKKLQKLEDENVMLKDDDNLKETHIDTLEAEIADLQEVVDEQKQTIERIAKEAKDLDTELSAEIDDRKRMEADYEALERTLQEVAQKGKRREKQVIELRQENGELKHEIDELKHENSVLEERFEEVTAKLLEYDQKLDDTEDKLDAMTDARDEAVAKWKDAENQMKGLRQQLELKNKIIAETRKKVQPVAAAPLPAAGSRPATNPTTTGRNPLAPRPAILKQTGLQSRR